LKIALAVCKEYVCEVDELMACTAPTHSVTCQSACSVM